ncbi:hypothetical protein BYT27DRAFT_7165730 [Phlegmacium glaucopus]|nr:hypothetical protein BYT27DRAFT_7165730 [Phlegmacium glaucopus]
MGGNQSVPKITAQDRAILDLKLQRDKLKQYQKKIQVILDREHTIAKDQIAAGQKDRALIALRRRKYQQSLLTKTDAQIENLEQLVSTIEFSLIEVSILHGLKQGNDILREIHKEMNVESVEKLLEETAEAREYQKEVGDMLSNHLSLDEEDAVQKELLELQQDIAAESKGPLDMELPSIPSSKPIERPKEDTKSAVTSKVPVAA